MGKTTSNRKSNTKKIFTPLCASNYSIHQREKGETVVKWFN